MSAWIDTDSELSALADQWSQEIQEGDVIRTKSGTLRVVRAVHRHPKASGKGSGKATIARRCYCFFAIRHCSWTGRPHTGYSIGEMVTMGWTPTAAKPRALDADIDRKLARDMEMRGRSQDNELTCCAVRGLP